jgi:hypothetical protein
MNELLALPVVRLMKLSMSTQVPEPVKPELWSGE